MAKYDGLIIPRSYNDYVNKSDPIGVSQVLQLTGVMDNAPTAQSTKPVKSGGIFAANAVIMANNKTLSGVAISAGSVVRVLFTAALTGSDTTTGLTLTYNGNAYAVKVGKNGALANFNAYEVESGVFKYLQAYTTLELMFDGTQFIIIGNPVVLSSADYTIYTDGSITHSMSYKLRGYINQVDFANTNTIPLNNTDEDILIAFCLPQETLGIALYPCKNIGTDPFKRIFVSHVGASPLYLVINIISRLSDGSIQCTCSTNYPGSGVTVYFYCR